MYAAANALTASGFDVTHLARSNAQEFEVRSKKLSVAKPFITWAVSHPFRLFAGYLTYKIERVAEEFASKAVWFRGATQAVSARPCERALDPDFELVRMLDEMLVDVQNVNQSTAALLEQRKANPSQFKKVTEALSLVVTSTQELFNEVETFRSAVIGYEQDRGAFLQDATAVAQYFSETDPVYRKLIQSSADMQRQIGAFDSAEDFDADLLAEARKTLQALKN